MNNPPDAPAHCPPRNLNGAFYPPVRFSAQLRSEEYE
jgi:hypothetical protein